MYCRPTIIYATLLSHLALLVNHVTSCDLYIIINFMVLGIGCGDSQSLLPE